MTTMTMTRFAAAAHRDFRDFGMHFVYEEGALIAYLLVSRGALGGDVQAAVVVHGDVHRVVVVGASRITPTKGTF